MQIRWEIKVIKNMITTSSWLTKQQVVIEEIDSKKKNIVCIDFLWENINLLADIKQWDICTIEFSLAINCMADGTIFNRISGTDIRK